MWASASPVRGVVRQPAEGERVLLASWDAGTVLQAVALAAVLGLLVWRIGRGGGT